MVRVHIISLCMMSIKKWSEELHNTKIDISSSDGFPNIQDGPSTRSLVKDMKKFRQCLCGM